MLVKAAIELVEVLIELGELAVEFLGVAIDPVELSTVEFVELAIEFVVASLGFVEVAIRLPDVDCIVLKVWGKPTGPGPSKARLWGSLRVTVAELVISMLAGTLKVLVVVLVVSKAMRQYLLSSSSNVAVYLMREYQCRKSKERPAGIHFVRCKTIKVAAT